MYLLVTKIVKRQDDNPAAKVEIRTWQLMSLKVQSNGHLGPHRNFNSCMTIRPDLLIAILTIAMLSENMDSDLGNGQL